MGQSTDAILFYGFTLREGDTLFSRYCEEHDIDESKFEGEDFEFMLAELFGGPKTDPLNPERRWQFQIAKEHEEYQRVTFGSAFESGIHCSDSYPIPYVAILGTTSTAWRGSPILIDVGDKAAYTDAWGATHKAALLKLATMLHLDIKDEDIGWHMCSYWEA